MSMFRRPTDDSSDSSSSSEEELDISNAGTDHSNAGTEEIAGADSTAGTLSAGEYISVDHSRDDIILGDAEHVRNMLLASLLEDFYRRRAADLFNAANPGAPFNRQSPEVQPLARNLFSQASQALSSNGILPMHVVTDDIEGLRSQYLTGLDHFGLQNIQNSDLLSGVLKRRISASENSLALVQAANHPHQPNHNAGGNSVRDLALRTDQLSIVPHPANDLKLSSMQQPRSHYQSSFQEMRLLGKGGFGRVYQTYNVFDKKEYAVKKIPLSVKLSQQYREKGHSELTSILKEVQALAQLDHCNVVRYHATWIEDPTAPFQIRDPTMFRAPFNRPRLIADRPAFAPISEGRRPSSTKLLSIGCSDGIQFEADSHDDNACQEGNGWSQNSHIRLQDSSMPDSDIFTDGMAHNNRSDKVMDDPSCYVLHVQMSMYPTTLAQYLSVSHNGARNGPATPVRRHCFHLIPALRIILGILFGLQYIHARGLIHRDIKPSNIFLSNYEIQNHMHSPDGYYDVGGCPSCPEQQPLYVNPRIGDFGLVAELARESEVGGSSGSSSASAVGTEYYRPPIGNGKKPAKIIDEKIDVYALGVVFVEMLWRCGTSMERINLLKDTQKGVVPPEVLSAISKEGYSSALVEMVKDCMEGMIQRDYSRRWTCSRVKERIEDLLARCHGGPPNLSQERTLSWSALGSIY